MRLVVALIAGIAFVTQPVAAASGRSRGAGDCGSDRPGRADRSATVVRHRARSDRARPGASDRLVRVTRAARRAAGADQGQYRGRRPASDHRRQPRACRQRHQSRCAAGRAAPLGRSHHPRQGQPFRMGQHPVQQFDFRLERGRRPGPQPVGARPQSVRLVERKRGGGRRRPRPARDRHGNRRVDHLPRGDQRHRRAEADRRTGQPDPHRSDQRQPGYRGADDRERPRGGRAADRDRRSGSGRRGHCRGRSAEGRLCRSGSTPTPCAASASA